MAANERNLVDQVDWNLDTIAEQIFSDLDGAVARTTIQEVLMEVIAKYEGACIQTYVTIFIRRDAVNKLKSMRVLYPAPNMAKDNTKGRDESHSHSDHSQLITTPHEQGKIIGTNMVGWKPVT